MKCKRSVTVPQKERMSGRINKALELRLGKNGTRNPFLIFLMNLVEITHFFNIFKKLYFLNDGRYKCFVFIIILVVNYIQKNNLPLVTFSVFTVCATITTI